MITEPSPAAALLLLLAVLVVIVAGVDQWQRGWRERADAAERSRLAAGQRARRRLRGAIEDRLVGTRPGHRLEETLAAAGVELGVVDFLGLAAAAGIAGTLLARLILPWWLAVAVGAGCVRGCWAWLEVQRRKRRDVLVTELPDVARILSNASSAGLSLRSAIDMAAAELQGPAAAELAYVAEELRVGYPVEAALAHLEQRMPSSEVSVLVATLVIQQRAGGDLVRALRDMADTLDARKDLRREVRTIMAGSVFTSYIVAGLGAASLVLLNTLSPGVIEDMTRSGPGRLALVIAGILYTAGFVLIRRTTRITT